MSKKLTITSDGDYYGTYSALGYLLEVENSEVAPLNIPLYEGQTEENYLFEILNASGISFKHKLTVGNIEEAEQEEGFGDFYSSNNDVIIESKNPPSGILIEIGSNGNIVLCNSLDEREMVQGFYIYTEGFMESPEEIAESLCNILTEIGASFEVI